MGNISKLGTDLSNQPGLANVRATLEEAVDKAVEDEFQKVIVIFLDDEGSKFDTSFYQAGMRLSEIVALMEVMKIRLLDEIRGTDS